MSGFFVLIKHGIQEFIMDREFKNLSPYSVKMYKTNLNEFHEFCVEESVVIIPDVTTSLVKKYLQYVKNERKNNEGTINNKIRSLKAFFTFLIEEEMINEKSNPMKRIKQIKEEIKIEVLSDNQVKMVLKHLDRQAIYNNRFIALRNRTIVIFLISTGVRRGELVNIKWSDVNFESYSIKVFGKKRQLASIPMSTKLKRELLEYRIYCEQFFGKLGDYVFCSQQNKKISKEAISSIFKKLHKELNFEGVRLSCHDFRHYFASKAIQNGIDVMTLQRILRHENIQMTQRYVNLWGTALQEQNEKYNPLNNLDI